MTISLFSEPNLLVRACNQLGQFLSHRETNLRYLALESMCLLATSEFSHEAVKKHQVGIDLFVDVPYYAQNCVTLTCVERFITELLECQWCSKESSSAMSLDIRVISHSGYLVERKKLRESR